MLQFWKKSKADNDKNCYASVSKPSNDNLTNLKNSPKVLPLSSFDDEGLFDIDEFESTKQKSKLCRTLQEVLSDKGALGYFMHYMESKNAAKYLMCWVDISLFKSVLNSKEQKLHTFSPLPFSKGDHDSLSVSTDCDSYTADTNSLCDYSTATISDKVTQSSIEVNSCDRDMSDTSPKKSFTEDVNDDKKGSLLENAVAIFKKYVAQEATHLIKCSEVIRNEIIENICDSEKVLSGHCFDKLQNYVFGIMEKEYFDAFVGCDYFCKYQIDVLTSGHVVLDDILYNETALFYFMEFLEQENTCTLLEFWIAATNLQQHLRNQKEFFDPIEAQSDAVVLYDKYFSLQAHCPLGFSDKVRFEVEQNICGENGLVIDCFNLPLKIVEQVMETNYLKPFLASQLFYKYLSELINTVQSNEYMVNIENKRPLSSDCSSERSFSTNSAFLALEINYQSTKRGKGTDMNIDTRQLCDPDSLWKRKRSHRLSCGRITALGKFETDLEPEPDKKGFTLKNVVRKFVSLDEDKKKEEMAWQVAEMIVKDITNVTLNHEKTRNSSL